MNCEECRDQLAAYLEGLMDDAVRGQIDGHITQCQACQAELQEVRQLVLRLARNTIDPAPGRLDNQVMDRILQQQAIELRRQKMRKRLQVMGFSGAMAAAVAVLFVVNVWVVRPAAAEKAAAEVLAQGAEATPHPTTVHIVAKMRTIGHDNFSMIGANYDFVSLEIWKQFGEKPKWRVEKPGHVAVMDGASTTMLIRPDYVVQFPGPSGAAFDTGWLLALTNVQDMVTHELRSAQARGWDLKLTHETTGSGEKKLLVTVEAKSGLLSDDYLKNKFFEDSDMRRVYRFDAKTRRLEGFDAYLRHSGSDVLILSIERIDYEQPIDPSVFALKLPAKVERYKEPERLPNNVKYEKLTPDQAARAFFEACAKSDWDEAQKFFWPCDDRIKAYLGGLQIVHLGTPFQSKGYSGWFIPYEIKLTMKAKFQVRNDNPAKRYVVFSPEDKLDAKRLAGLKPLPDQEKYAKMSPKEVVEALFAAYAKNDVAGVYKFVEGSESFENVKQEMKAPPIADYHVGQPTQGKEAGCWEVPVEIKVLKKHNLAMRSDNPAKRYVVDGGI
jgi:hypothetical protein